jgi:hypothetical protein
MCRSKREKIYSWIAICVIGLWAILQFVIGWSVLASRGNIEDRCDNWGSSYIECNFSTNGRHAIAGVKWILSPTWTPFWSIGWLINQNNKVDNT